MPHILLTNPEPHILRLAALCRARGATVVSLPLFCAAAPADGGAALRAALAQMEQYHWIVFTSQFAVEGVASAPARAAPAGRVGAAWAGPRIATVGEATAAAVRAHGAAVDLVAPDGGAAAIAEALIAAGVRGMRMLLPQKPDARPELRSLLLSAGAAVHAVEAYRMQPVAIDPRAWRVGQTGAPFDAVVLTAPSAVRRFVHLFGGPPYAAPFTRAAWHVIGATTAGEAVAKGLTPVCQSPTARFEALADALCGE